MSQVITRSLASMPVSIDTNYGDEPPPFMSAKQAAAYLQINEKKIYELANEGQIPGTKVTGKWLFPRDLVDHWLTESSHGGVLADRMLIAGAEDLLVSRTALSISRELDTRALMHYSASGTRLGLGLLSTGRVDATVLSWGRDEESHLRHPALMKRYSGHDDWVLVRLCKRRDGILLRAGIQPTEEQIAQPRRRWVFRDAGTGAQRFLTEVGQHLGINTKKIRPAARAHSATEAAALLVRQKADLATGSQALAQEYGLGFFPVDWVCVDVATARAGYFRTLFQDFVATIGGTPGRQLAAALSGYDLRETGKLLLGR